MVLTFADFELEELIAIFARVKDDAVWKSTSIVDHNFVTNRRGVSRTLSEDLKNVPT